MLNNVRSIKLDVGLYKTLALKIIRSKIFTISALFTFLTFILLHHSPQQIDSSIYKNLKIPSNLTEFSHSLFDEKIEIEHIPHNENKSEKFIFIDGKYPTTQGYKLILDDYSPEKFAQKSLADKCSIYFEKLYEKKPDWRFEELENGYPYNGYIFDTKDRFMTERREEYRNSLDNKETITDEEFQKLIKTYNKDLEWEARYNKERQDSFDTEQYMSDQMGHLRVFSQCYLNNEITTTVQNQIDSFDSKITCATNEKKLFKYLTRKFPTYTRWNREELSTPPKIDNYLKNPDYHTPRNSSWKSSGCFTRDLRDTYNGKGIVISAADKHLTDLKSLLLVLRALKNELPIQIVHRGDLSIESQMELSKISRSMSLNLDQVSNFKKVIQRHFQDQRELDVESLFPKQEIWYVNATTSINPDDKRFITYGNKLLTLLFSSFEDTVLIDTDTVPFVDIDEYILQSSVYLKNGAFFFKDRQLYDRMSGPELTYFRKLLPTRLDTAFFNIPELTEVTYKNRFFGDGFKHVQESGLVAINKKRHIRSVLTINALQMWHAATTRVHGDKELFWLGFSIAGDEDYYLNKYGVGAVGVPNPNSNRLLGDENDSKRSKLKSNMLCTTHPAHLSGLDDHTLLWMNSGFITCKRQDEAIKDIKMDLYKKIFESSEQLKQHYMAPLKITAVLVPPPQELVVNNDLGEPSSGWDVMFGCGGYLYCAYDRVGGSDEPEHRGTFVQYDEDQVLLYDYLGELWVYSDKVVNDFSRVNENSYLYLNTTTTWREISGEET